MIRATLATCLALLVLACGKYGPPSRTPPGRRTPPPAPEAALAAEEPQPSAETPESDEAAPDPDAEESEE